MTFAISNLAVLADRIVANAAAFCIVVSSHYSCISQFKVAYYSFQKRKTTFLELKFKANRSFSFGSFVAITVKKNKINPHYPGKVI